MEWFFQLFAVMVVIGKTIQVIVEQIKFVQTKGEEGKDHTYLFLVLGVALLAFIAAMITISFE